MDRLKANPHLHAVLVMALGLVSTDIMAAGGKTEKRRDSEALKAFAAGDYQTALERYAELYADTHHPIYRRNIGRCHQKIGKDPQKAIDAFHDYLDKAKGLAADDVRQVQGYIKEMQELLDRQHRQEAPPVPAAKVEPPRTPSPMATLRIVEATPEPSRDVPPEAPAYKRWWFWTGVGAVVAGAIVAGFVVSSSRTSKPGCPSDGTICP